MSQQDVFREMYQLKKAGQRGAVATVVARKGSAPMSGDAKMLVRQDGSTVGTVGGGCLEAEVWQAAMNIMESGRPEKLTFDLTAQQAGDSGHICGGVVDILVEPFDAYDSALLAEIADIRSRGGSAALATVVQPGRLGDLPAGRRKQLIRRDGSARGEIPEYSAELWRESSQVIRNGQPSVLTFASEEERTGKRRRQPGEGTEIFLEPITGQPLVYLFGGGHVSFCVAQAVHLAGFRVAVVEDRPTFANQERFPMAEAFYVGEFPAVFGKIPVDESDYMAIITRGHANDEVVLEWALKTPARYIGMIGSKSKVLLTYRHLRDKGFDQDELLRRVHAPIGLEIGADTPGEIAVAIVAEFIRFRRLGEEAGQSGVPGKRIQLRKKA
ncbi:MAG: XdhC family protein [Candidatus Tectomicrobia bacterium]|uniref:XdhC family protein n=1 Tax=Tectimicrobiota bacterium TaxID=2528274 RepID=A0A932I2P8_UNCTE|nr:XdhC family protein [Candidatus Tectomicrobia bacterium]